MKLVLFTRTILLLRQHFTRRDCEKQSKLYSWNAITSIDKRSQTQLLIFFIAKRCFYIAVLTTTCFGRYVGHHQVVHSLIFKVLKFDLRPQVRN